MVRIGLCLLAFAFGTASANTYTVTSLNDSGSGTLREAVGLANGDAAADTINFAVTGTITLTSGQILIYTPMTIQGPGAGLLTIDGNANNRIFLIYENVPDVCAAPGSDFAVTISGLTLTNAKRQSDTTVGGAIYAEKTLTLSNVAVLNSQAKSGGGLAWVTRYAGQTLTISDSRFSGNVALPVVAPSGGNHVGGAVDAFEGCSTTGAKVIDIERSVFDDNHVQPQTLTDAQGGGIRVGGNGSYTVIVKDTRITGNSIDPPASPPTGYNYRGGGLRITNVFQTVITGSEISANSAARHGGLSVVNTQASLQTAETATLVQIVNSTISGNAADGSGTDGRSGGVAAVGNLSLQILNSTITGNTAAIEADGLRLTTDVTTPATSSNALPPTLYMRSTIVSGNGSDDLSLDTTVVPTLDADVSNSLLGVVGTGITLTGIGNLSSTSPGLAALAFNGGLTRTHALKTGSPAIDTGSNVINLIYDQRGAGFPRTAGAGTDIGAYERAASAKISAAPVPALSERALGLLALFVLFAGFHSLRRRR